MLEEKLGGEYGQVWFNFNQGSYDQGSYNQGSFNCDGFNQDSESTFNHCRIECI